jgi:hypothetical protein
MLAEIFMVRLEARARLTNEAGWPGDGRFVPFVQGDQVTFKERATRLSRPAPCPAPMVEPDGIEHRSAD